MLLFCYILICVLYLLDHCIGVYQVDNSNSYNSSETFVLILHNYSEVDNDLDGFSIIEVTIIWITLIYDIVKQGHMCFKTMRGTDWKGKDCDDFDSNIHPGAIAGSDTLKDSNCNGIWVWLI